MGASFLLFIFIIYGNNYFPRLWQNTTDNDFRNKLFWSAFIIRIIAMFVLLAISYSAWDTFFYVGAKDEMVYYRIANEAERIWANLGLKEAYSHILNSFKGDISDTGFSTFLMLIVSITGLSPVLIKLILCALGSYAVIRGYRLASMVFDQPTARLAGVFLMLFPVSWFYSAIMLKEGVMVLLITEVLIFTIRLQKKFTFTDLIIVLVLIILIFFFRSALSILLIMVLGFSLFMQRKKKSIALNIMAAILALSVFYFFLQSTGEFDIYYEEYIGIDEYTESRVSYMEQINPFVALVGSPVFVVVALIGPFPTVIKTPLEMGLSHSEYYYMVAGNLYYIVLAFFSLFGLYHAIRFKRQLLAPLYGFILGYQFVLLKAMMFTSVRFAYPAKPFLFIMAAYGIYSMKSKRWYPVYLAGALVMVIGWNYVKLKGRGG